MEAVKAQALNPQDQAEGQVGLHKLQEQGQDQVLDLCV